MGNQYNISGQAGAVGPNAIPRGERDYALRLLRLGIACDPAPHSVPSPQW
jgi:hypothetical protein